MVLEDRRSPNSPNSSNNQVQQPNRGFRRTESIPSQQPSYSPPRNDGFRNLVVSVEEAAHLVAE